MSSQLSRLNFLMAQRRKDRIFFARPLSVVSQAERSPGAVQPTYQLFGYTAISPYFFIASSPCSETAIPQSSSCWPPGCCGGTVGPAAGPVTLLLGDAALAPWMVGLTRLDTPRSLALVLAPGTRPRA